MDFYPTILEMAGLPLRPDLHMDGQSLVPLLKKKKAILHDAIYFHYPHHSNQKGGPSGAIREGDYKLLVFFEDNNLELYNIKEDIGENTNLAEKMPERRDQMLEKLQKWWLEVDARFPDGYKDLN
jgi:arylsulfatase A-like enzyme